MMHPSFDVVKTPTRPDDLSKKLDVDGRVTNFNVQKMLVRFFNENVLSGGIEKDAQTEIAKLLAELQASGAINNFNIVETSLVSGIQLTFDEVNDLHEGVVPGDPYFEVEPATGKQCYAGIVIYSDGTKRGLIFRGHEGGKEHKVDTVKVHVSVQVPHSIDSVFITVETGDNV